MRHLRPEFDVIWQWYVGNCRFQVSPTYVSIYACGMVSPSRKADPDLNTSWQFTRGQSLSQLQFYMYYCTSMSWSTRVSKQYVCAI